MPVNKREMRKIGTWLIDGDTGMSSESMAAVALGGSPSQIYHPLDASDFARCAMFLEQCIDPSKWNSLILQMAHFTAAWHRIAANWIGLYELYKKEKYDELYHRMILLKL